ncbi:MAG TPA: hypothetical protein VNM69_02260 [Bacillus sp. (in: firmicutes)]|nr:hypothetical protein [Bacillus sp. (in: firmicutes)]
MSRLSPFSIQHEWRVAWKEETRKPHENAQLWFSPKEEPLFQTLATVGIAGGAQLSSLYFKGDKKRLSKLERLGKLSRHTLWRGKQEIPLYTLGPTVIDMYKSMYDLNGWFQLTISDILQRLVLFQFLKKFHEISKNGEIKVLPAPSPYTAIIERNGIPFFVLIVRGNEGEVLNLFKWSHPQERIICIKESLTYASHLNEHLSKCKVRMTTDFDFKKPFHQMFYQWNGVEWVPENGVNTQSTQQVKTEKKKLIIPVRSIE